MSKHEQDDQDFETQGGYTEETMAYDEGDEANATESESEQRSSFASSDSGADKKKKLINMVVLGLGGLGLMGGALYVGGPMVGIDLFGTTPPPKPKAPIQPLPAEEAPAPMETPTSPEQSDAADANTASVAADPFAAAVPSPAAPSEAAPAQNVPADPFAAAPVQSAPTADPFAAAPVQNAPTADPFAGAPAQNAPTADPFAGAAPSPVAPAEAVPAQNAPAAAPVDAATPTVPTEPTPNFQQQAQAEPTSIPSAENQQPNYQPLTENSVSQSDVAQAVESLSKRIEALERSSAAQRNDGPAMKAIATLKKRMARLETRFDEKFGPDTTQAVSPQSSTPVVATQAKEKVVSKKGTAADKDTGAKKIVSSGSMEGELFVKEEKAPKRKYVASSEREYILQAVIPGRIWVKMSDGSSKTFEEGETMPDGSKILKIDAEKGIVKMNNGILE